jgi:hypothetical protein
VYNDARHSIKFRWLAADNQITETSCELVVSRIAQPPPLGDAPAIDADLGIGGGSGVGRPDTDRKIGTAGIARALGRSLPTAIASTSWIS